MKIHLKFQLKSVITLMWTGKLYVCSFLCFMGFKRNILWITIWFLHVFHLYLLKAAIPSDASPWAELGCIQYWLVHTFIRIFIGSDLWLGSLHCLSDLIPENPIRFHYHLCFCSLAVVREMESTRRLDAALIVVWFTVGLFARIDPLREMIIKCK